MVRCALAAGDTLVKADQNGVLYTFAGQLGMAPQWKDNACDATCQQGISACMLAHVNTKGVHIPLWLDSPSPAIGWGTDPQYPNREGTFFGNIMKPNPSSGLIDAFYCNGPGFSTDTVPGRLGANQTGAPYSDPYISKKTTNGYCVPCYAPRPDGATTCPGDTLTFQNPITVWRGQTFQAESAVLSQGPVTILCGAGMCSGNYRVGYIGPYATVTFNNVFSSTTASRTLIVYYSNGDSCGATGCSLYFNISVHGGPQQSKAFPVVKAGSWDTIGSQAIQLDGFVQGTANTITFKGDLAHSAPDLDWIEVE